MPDSSLLWQKSFADKLATEPLTPTLYKEILAEARARSDLLFNSGTGAKDLILARSQLIDKLLTNLWLNYFQEDNSISLLAVGGYGRQELHPYSDIDLLILLKNKETKKQESKLSDFLSFLWDTGMILGYSVRTLSECVSAAAEDLTIFTNILESRHLAGKKNLQLKLTRTLNENNIWPSPEFFKFKLKEQQLRHEKFNDTEYKLEPNIKQGPGGLRDLQNIIWITRRQFGSIQLHELLQHGFLTKKEYVELNTAKETLWNVRMALHISAGRAEERILFDYQPELAEILGFKGDDTNQKVENFMHSYYLALRSLSFLNELLLQLFRETFFTGENTAVKINTSFIALDNLLTTIEPEQFKKRPSDLLYLFITLAQNPELTGVRARTIRDIRASLSLIDDRFRQDSNNKKNFLSLFKNPGLTHALRRMHRYGILGAYLPEFANITGRMQYDLFHTLTIDEHSLFVLRNLRRLSLKQFEHELPVASSLMAEIKKPWVLYLAGLFHDIGKGQNGDHSKIGKKIAVRFCKIHGIKKTDSKIVAWLVRNHLLMSITAQRQDIEDKEVVASFSSKIKNIGRLQMLYLLTIADIRATNPDLWNDWKASLLHRLYIKAKNILVKRADEERSTVLIRKIPIQDKTRMQAIWDELGADYLHKFLPEEIYWQSKLILKHKPPIVRLKKIGAKGASVLFVYSKDQDFMFAKLVSALEKFPIRILEANIYTAPNQYVVDTFQLLDNALEPISDKNLLQEITKTIKKKLNTADSVLSVSAPRLSRHQKHFKFATKVKFYPAKLATKLEVIASCRPNLLTLISKVLADNRIRVHKASIATIGERAEDIFSISDLDNNALSKNLETKIKFQLEQELD